MNQYSMVYKRNHIYNAVQTTQTLATPHSISYKKMKNIVQTQEANDMV